MKMAMIKVSVPYRGATFLNFSPPDIPPPLVSVPYRGATFLNPGFGSSYSILAIKVSVPYRGATFLNATPQ